MQEHLGRLLVPIPGTSIAPDHLEAWKSFRSSHENLRNSNRSVRIGTIGTIIHRDFVCEISPAITGPPRKNTISKLVSSTAPVHRMVITRSECVLTCLYAKQLAESTSVNVTDDFNVSIDEDGDQFMVVLIIGYCRGKVSVDRLHPIDRHTCQENGGDRE